MKDKNNIDTCPECGNRQDKNGKCEWCGHIEKY